MSYGLLFDSTRCIGCQGCSAACKEQNNLPETVEPRTTAYTWTTVEQHAGVFIRRLCMHCEDPACVSVCPVGALTKDPHGPVVYNAERCIGCRYCLMACPFGVPKYQWDRAIPIVGKCILCASRVQKGQPAACAEVCPTGATTFGQRETLITEAADRLRARPGAYVQHIYGLEEAGGTGVLLLSGVPFETLGLSVNLPKQPLPMLTWQILSKVPDFVAVAAAFLYGIHWITKRRDAVAAAAQTAEPHDHGGTRR
ncbi:MAG: 4Fe-4S dicluster domain-containing protein [Vicinamibacteria bacterium]|jgi:formate dehydrogenase iron-sulfur subunit|nr:4Fe-4S dicluster domain-containing protein [Vicinamibacteria bacterium]